MGISPANVNKVFLNNVKGLWRMTKEEQVPLHILINGINDRLPEINRKCKIVKVTKIPKKEKL